MLFNSYAFIFLFLPIATYVFYILGKSFNPIISKLWLVGISLVFYGWFSPSLILLLIFSILVNAGVGNQLVKHRSKPLLISGLIFNLGLIIIFKYSQFITDNMAWLFDFKSPNLNIILPLAISFFTFQQIAYIVDCYQGKVRSNNFLNYCLFIVFFPQLIAGPIVQHHQVIPQFEHKNFVNLKSRHIALGLSIFIVGLFKKVMFADNCAVFANPIFDAAEQGVVLTFFESWWGAIAYTLQLYFDFSGYSDMAIGLALLFNIKLPVNFNSPYKAINIIDFWRRWHITLSTFLRDYLYIPLGGNRHGNYQKQLNLMITMLLGGFWHGASWNFVIWGGLHGSYLVINHTWRTLRQKYLGHDLSKSSFLSSVISRALTLCCIIIAWVFFRAQSFAGAKHILSSMLGFNGISLVKSFENKLGSLSPWLLEHGIYFNGLFTNELADLRSATLLMLLLFMCALLLPNTQQFLLSPTKLSSNVNLRQNIAHIVTWRKNVFWAIFIGILGMLSVLSLAKASDFIYFQF